MSLYRFLFYSAVIGGWAAFLAWMVAEIFLLRGRSGLGTLLATLTATGVAAAIGAGLNLVSGITAGRWKRSLRPLHPAVLRSRHHTHSRRHRPRPGPIVKRRIRKLLGDCPTFRKKVERRPPCSLAGS